MKSKTLHIVALALVGLGFITSGCGKHRFCLKGDSRQITETRNLGEFQVVEMAFPGELIIVQMYDSDNPYAEISGSKNLVNNLETNVHGKTLELEPDRCVNGHDNIKVTLYINNISELKINGSGDVRNEGVLKSEHLELNINGSGDMNLDLDVTTLHCHINGSGDIALHGNSPTHKVYINGSGNVNAFAFESETVEVDVNGSGTVKVNADKQLTAEISGSGDVYYVGSPSVEVSVTGSGNVIKQ